MVCSLKALYNIDLGAGVIKSMDTLSNDDADVCEVLLYYAS